MENADDKMTILKKLRLEKNLSLRKLAVLADVDQSTISGIENGHKRAQEITLRKLAKALEVEYSVLEELKDIGASERGKAGGLASAKKENGRQMLVSTPVVAL